MSDPDKLVSQARDVIDWINRFLASKHIPQSVRELEKTLQQWDEQPASDNPPAGAPGDGEGLFEDT